MRFHFNAKNCVSTGNPVSRPPLNLTVVSGVDVYLRCPASGYPIETTVWQYGGKKLFSGSKHKVFDNGTLLAKQVSRLEDQGSYKCTISNKIGHSASGQLYLNIMGERPNKGRNYFCFKLED